MRTMSKEGILDYLAVIGKELKSQVLDFQGNQVLTRQFDRLYTELEAVRIAYRLIRDDNDPIEVLTALHLRGINGNAIELLIKTIECDIESEYWTVEDGYMKARSLMLNLVDE